jgi:alpha-beta hydrolase superfamily lysophospholipase
MKATEWRWTCVDGLDMQALEWEPDGPARGLVVLVHGFDDHGARYGHVGKAFTEAGFVLCSYDARGHGRSGGKRAFIDRYDQLLDDVGTFLELVTHRHPRLPRFLYGHSMGGNQVLNFLLRRHPRLLGAIATSPWLELAVTPPGWQLAAARVAARLLGGVALPTGMDAAGISHDPEVVRAYQADPLVGGKITPKLLVHVLDAGQWALQHAGELKVPLLLLHGDSDQITSFGASQRFARSAGPLVTFRGWPGGFHELHNEPERVQVLKVITDWLGARVEEAPGPAART